MRPSFQLLLLLICCPIVLLAQEGEKDGENGFWDEDWDDWKGDIGYSDTIHALTNWAGIDLAVTGYMTPGGNFDPSGQYGNWKLDYARSIGWDLNLFEKRFALAGRHFGLVTGIGFDWDRYAFEKKVSVTADADSTWAFEDGTDYDVNKLKTTYLRVPLLFEVNSSEIPENSFHIAVGAIGGWRIHSEFEQQFSVNGTEITREKEAGFNIRSFRYSLTTRLGYGNYNIFFEYSPMPLFERDEGPEFYPFSAGVTLLGF